MSTNWRYTPELPEEGEAVWAEIRTDGATVLRTPIQLNEGVLRYAEGESPEWSWERQRYEMMMPIYELPWHSKLLRWHRYPDPREGEKKQ